jgi:DNA processing protein
MTAGDTPAGQRLACTSCLCRSWLLAQLSGPLDCNCRDDGRLLDLLALDDGDMMKALGGRRLTELRSRHARFRPSEPAQARDLVEICKHDPRYPRALLTAPAPPMLFASGGVERLVGLTAQPLVAIVGTARATDYGIAIAAALARGLAASGVTVVVELADGIARAAQAGALETRGTVVAVLGGGLDVAAPARLRPLLNQIKREGMAVSELPCGTAGRRWGAAAAVRIVAAMAAVMVVVEAEDGTRELAGARIAQSLGRAVAAVPGRVTSRASWGSHALLGEGAQLVTGAGDVLDLLFDAGRPTRSPRNRQPRLEARLQGVLERVAAGLDTPQKLIGGANEQAGELLQALSELELIGLLSRGDGGRYVPCSPLGAPGVR